MSIILLFGAAALVLASAAAVDQTPTTLPSQVTTDANTTLIGAQDRKAHIMIATNTKKSKKMLFKSKILNIMLLKGLDLTQLFSRPFVGAFNLAQSLKDKITNPIVVTISKPAATTKKPTKTSKPTTTMKPYDPYVDYQSYESESNYGKPYEGKPYQINPHEKPYGEKPFGKPIGEKPFGKPFGEKPYGKPFAEEPYGKPYGKPHGKPYGGKPYAEKPYGGKPYVEKPHLEKPSFLGKPMSEVEQIVSALDQQGGQVQTVENPSATLPASQTAATQTVQNSAGTLPAAQTVAQFEPLSW